MCSTSRTTSCAGAHGPEDLNGLRNNVPYLDALDAEMIPSPTAGGDFMRRFREADVVELMEALNAVRPQLWKGRGRDLLGRWPMWTWMGRWRRRRARRRRGWTCPTRACGATIRW